MYFIATTTRSDSHDYAPLVETIKALGPWSNRLRDVWLVQSTLSARRIRDLLKPHIHEGDRLFVGEMTQNWAGRNMGREFPDWIGRRSFGQEG